MKIYIMSDNIQITEHRKNEANSSFTPAQLDLGLLVDNPPDNLFEQDDINEKEDKKDNKFNIQKHKTQSDYGIIDRDDLESMHGDDNRVIMSDGGADNEFPKVSSDDDDESHYDKSRDSRDRNSDNRSERSERDSEESLSKSRKLYMQMKQYCKKKNVEFPSHLRPDSPYHELKSHMSLLRSEYQMEKSVEMCKKMLVSFASVFEYLNNT